MVKAQREYKDRLFIFIFGSEEHKDWTLSLFNAMNGTDYTDASIIQFTTLKEILYMKTRNDVSFLIAPIMNLYEQQSTLNPNMPFRLLRNLVELYDRYVNENSETLYGKNIVQLPVPRLAVFYNGRTEVDDETIQRLSDAFPPEQRHLADVAVNVHVFNINKGRNPSIQEKCKPLAEYSWTVDRIREFEKELKDDVPKEELLETAIDRTLDEMPEDFVIKEYLLAHRAEVKGMIITEYDEARELELIRKEGTEGITDDAMIVESVTDTPVRFAMGDYRNIKITTPEDLLIAAAFSSDFNKNNC